MDSMESTMNTTGTSNKVGRDTLEEAKGGFDDVDGHVPVPFSQHTSMKTGTGKTNSMVILLVKSFCIFDQVSVVGCG